MIRRVIGILTSVAIVCSGVLVLESRAADEGSRPAAVKPVAAAVPAPVKAAAGKSPTADAKAAKPPAPGAPQVPEESATIRDDPTIAPDPKQSADNNVSFPSDI
jgi:hypothetical protein